MRTAKWMFLLVGILVSFSSFAGPGKRPAPDRSLFNPPFWLPMYDELQDWKQDRRDFYLARLTPLLPKVPGFSDWTPDRLADTAEWSEGWKALREKLSRLCDMGGDVTPICDQIADARIQASMMRTGPSHQVDDDDELQIEEESAAAPAKATERRE